MDTKKIRDFAMYAAIFGVFGFSWFGWAQENPPESWRIFLGIGSLICIVIAGIGIYLAIKNWNAASALTTKNDYRLFSIVVATEVVLMLLGSVILSMMGKTTYIPNFIAFIVAIHFIPLVFIFRDKWLYVLTGIAIFAAVLPLILKNLINISTVTLTGIFMGTILLIFASRGLILFFISNE